MAVNIRLDDIGHEPMYSQKSALVQGTDERKVVSQHASNDDEVIIGSAEANIEGVVMAIEKDGLCAISARGFHKVSYSGSAPARGNKVELVANGSGGVKVPATPGTGKYFTVKKVITATTQIIVWLG